MISIKSRIKNLLHRQRITEPVQAYNAWAAGYDDQPGNLMLELDNQVTGDFLGHSEIKGKVIVDVGCGTGRHWAGIMAMEPRRLVGFDVSPGMLARLREKFPEAETYILNDNQLTGLESAGCDFVISTLTVAHIPDLENALTEWNRVLKDGGEVFISDYHPDALARGGQRTFKQDGKTVVIRNHVHTIQEIRRIARQLGWVEFRFTERLIDDSVREFYVLNRALAVYEKFRGTRIIYGLHFKKKA